MEGEDGRTGRRLMDDVVEIICDCNDHSDDNENDDLDGDDAAFRD